MIPVLNSFITKISLAALMALSFDAAASPRSCVALLKSAAVASESFAGKEFEKYNTPTVVKFHFNDKSLNLLQGFYHQLPVPKIVEDILTLRDADSNKLMKEAPGYFIWNPSKTTFMTVNPTYTRAATVVQALKYRRVETLKEDRNGIALITWFVHPELLARKGVSDKISNLEKSGTRYLVSILDLQLSDVPYLKETKKMAMDYLKRNFGASENKDDIRLDFHFPYAIETSTLHLHARVNKPSHPLELTKSYSIEEVIAYLEAGKSVKDLILDRQEELGGFYFSSKSAKLLESLSGQRMVEVPNPFLPSPELNPCSFGGCSP